MIKKNQNRIDCVICRKNSARIIRVSRSYSKGENLLVIENVPIISCSNCGESYLTAKTLHEIENIKRNRSNLTVERLVPVAIFV